MPQIYRIISSQDVKGIVAASFYFDALGYIITPIYGYLQGFPISAYGETFPILAQKCMI